MSTKPQRGVNWRPEEDEALCKGWVSVSEDGAIGTNQASDTFWKRVYQKFLENYPALVDPSDEHIKPLLLDPRLLTNNVLFGRHA
ncbi:hypothetical protein L3X38_042870 [Prunus dulcis]|uniref:Uncharacterized protein n=1 Tax=Prunus dulcis TaxID=3755 RepID=A0AAD4UVS0_PRUDU|nr:hypothetical protein L3X38_042870 [Prunus dulcis]